MDKRKYPDEGLKEPIHEYKSMLVETVRALFRKPC